jgi:hypothetical protein
MAALTKARNTPRLGDDIHPYDFPIAANVKVFLGSIACIDGTNKRLVPGASTSTLKCVGRARDTYDNTGGPAAAFRCAVDSGVFRWDNSTSGDLITQADVGNICYVVDDHTVAKTDNSGARPAAGKVIDVDSVGVWVEMKHAS